MRDPGNEVVLPQNANYKQLLDEVFVISRTRIIKVEVLVISRGRALTLITDYSGYHKNRIE